MTVKFTEHARNRMKERGISEKIARATLLSPDKVEQSSTVSTRFLIKKIYFHADHRRDHLLILICEEERNATKVITIIDTSKISKYI